jgi:hypothetical protein
MPQTLVTDFSILWRTGRIVYGIKVLETSSEDLELPYEQLPLSDNTAK